MAALAFLCVEKGGSMEVQFLALVKKAESKALVSGDKAFQIVLRGSDPRMGEVILAPANEEVSVTINIKGSDE